MHYKAKAPHTFEDIANLIADEMAKEQEELGEILDELRELNETLDTLEREVAHSTLWTPIKVD